MQACAASLQDEGSRTMTDTTRGTGWISRGARAVTVAVCALALATGAALAQQPPAKKDQKGKAPPPAAKKEPAKKGAEAPQSAWVKLCEKAPIVLRDKEGKPTREQRNICLTHHERLDGNSGMVLVSAALRQVEGGTSSI